MKNLNDYLNRSYWPQRSGGSDIYYMEYLSVFQVMTPKYFCILYHSFSNHPDQVIFFSGPVVSFVSHDTQVISYFPNRPYQRSSQVGSVFIFMECLSVFQVMTPKCFCIFYYSFPSHSDQVIFCFPDQLSILPVMTPK